MCLYFDTPQEWVSPYLDRYSVTDDIDSSWFFVDDQIGSYSLDGHTQFDDKAIGVGENCYQLQIYGLASVLFVVVEA